MQTNLFLSSKGKQLQTEAYLVFSHVKLKSHTEYAAAKTTVFLGVPSPTIQIKISARTENKHQGYAEINKVLRSEKEELTSLVITQLQCQQDSDKYSDHCEDDLQVSNKQHKLITSTSADFSRTSLSGL